VYNKNPTEKIAAEKTTDELDDILDEVVNLAKAVKGQKPFLDNMVTTGEETVEATNPAMLPGETLELEIDLPIKATESEAKQTFLAEEAEQALDALIEAENEFMDALAKEVGANFSADSSSTLAVKEPESKNTEKSFAEDSNTREESGYDAALQNTISEGTSDKLPEYNDQSSDHCLVGQESESELKDISAHVGEGSTPQVSIDQLTDVLRQKIEATIARLVEERLSVIVGRSIAETLESILENVK
jgi:hypothetical protein